MTRLHDAQWRKSSRSVGGDACVEVADLSPQVGVRDSKNPAGPALVFSRSAWTRFAAEVKADRHQV